MLVASLAYTKVSYFDWFKHIFKIILKLFIGLFIIIGIISLFI